MLTSARPQEIQSLINEEQDAPSSAEEEKPSASHLGKTYTSRLNPKYLGRPDEHQGVKNEDEIDDLPSTLQVRTKKRLSFLTPEEKTLRVRPRPSTTHADRNNKPKSGSKRKFDPEEYGDHATTPGSDVDFQFSRSAQVSQKPSEDAVSEQAARTPGQEQQDGGPLPRNHEPPKRKVLQPSMSNHCPLQTQIN